MRETSGVREGGVQGGRGREGRVGGKEPKRNRATS